MAASSLCQFISPTSILPFDNTFTEIPKYPIPDAGSLVNIFLYPVGAEFSVTVNL